jgi:hypothetical protein
VTTDTSTSPVIDVGDPTWDYSLEPTPNGGRVNMGRYGATPEASKSPSSGSVSILETGEWYPTLSQALTSISTNTMTGDRTIEVSAGTYLESASPLQTIETNSHVLTIRNASGANNVVFNGDLFDRTIGLDLRLTDTSTAVVSGIAFKNYTTYGIKVTNGSSVTIDSVTVSNSGDTCVYESGVKNSFNVVHSSASGCSYGVQAVSAASGGSVFVSSNALSSTIYGFYLNGGGAANSVTVSSNAVSMANGIYITNNADGAVLVSGNVITAPITTTRFGIRLQNLSNGATVQYNDIRFTSPSGNAAYGLYLQSVYHATIHHNTINAPESTSPTPFNGIYLTSSPDTDITFNDIYANPGTGISSWLYFGGATVFSTGTYIAHNILVNGLGTAATGFCFANTSQQTGTVSNYNDVYNFTLTGVYSGNRVTFAAWQAVQDAQGISLNPLWVSTTTAAPDFHVRSPSGRYLNGSWVTTDTSTSPVIDKGDPTQAYSREPQPNGCRVNMGRYGNTVEASKSTSTIGGIAACGLRYYDGTQIVNLACESSCDAPTSQLRFFKEGVIYGLPLVDIADPNASTLRINVPAGIKAIRKFP